MKKVEIKAPKPGEAVTHVEVAGVYFESGSHVEMNEDIISFDSDKATLDIPAPATGKIEYTVNLEVGEEIPCDSIIGHILVDETEPKPSDSNTSVSPELEVEPVSPEPSFTQKTPEPKKESHLKTEVLQNGKTREKLSGLRKSAIKLFLESKLEQAQLTTFNEIDMTNVINLRKKYQDAFVKTHGIKLGFMSLFSRASALGIKKYPVIGSQIDFERMEQIYFDHVNIGIAVSTEKGLLAPVVRNLESLGLAEIEREVDRLAKKMRSGRPGYEDLKGSNFMITNGGIFGSLMSTPMLTKPHSAILGMHNIVERPVVVNGEIKIRPMMYVALSYDHCAVDGKDSVSFLAHVKHLLENPMELIDGKSLEKELLNL